MPSLRAACLDRSTLRPGGTGPQSLTRTFTERPLSRLVTTACEPRGICLDAAVNLRESKRSPVAVRCPCTPGPYHDASPTTVARETGEALVLACWVDSPTRSVDCARESTEVMKASATARRNGIADFAALIEKPPPSEPERFGTRGPFRYESPACGRCGC